MALTYAYYTWRTKVPLVFSALAVQEAILQLIRDEMRIKPTPHVKIYDLGAGFGGLCFAVAKAFPEAEVIGLEMGWPMWLTAIARKILRQQKNLIFILGDFWKHDISDGSIVLCYLGDAVMGRLKDKLLRERCPGRLFISNTFPLPADWPPIRCIKIENSLSKEVLVYRQE